MTPLISVLLPVRNAADHLPQALESLLAQTFADFEILAVDDASDDGGLTLAVLEEYAGRDARIRAIAAGRLGIAGALNLAAQRSRGRYLARMDADDACEPERLRLQAEHLEASPLTDVVGCRVRFGGDPAVSAGYARHVGWINTLESHEAMALGAFRDAPLAHPSVMFRASAFARLGGYRQGPYPEDYELWLRWLNAGARFAKLPQTLLTWNDPPGRLSRTDPRYSLEAFHALKAGYLAGWLAANNPHHPEVIVVGAGRVTRRRAEHLCSHGVRIRAYLDIDPRKIGQVHQGRPVLHHRDVPPPGEAFVVSYVSTPGAAEHVAAFLNSRGYRAGRAYIQAG
ncbi:glycosyltransferase [Fundidesulfovibrio terrae]|uniref:glycosyltransferase n=1 Tax=Fundidesulfovibrio terrae TaxID=2922866 RepID=UPI001FAFD0F2|nr:glycosyltransferase [Fundidesulfovibrio terrae]